MLPALVQLGYDACGAASNHTFDRGTEATGTRDGCWCGVRFGHRTPTARIARLG